MGVGGSPKEQSLWKGEGGGVEVEVPPLQEERKRRGGERARDVLWDHQSKHRVARQDPAHVTFVTINASDGGHLCDSLQRGPGMESAAAYIQG